MYICVNVCVCVCFFNHHTNRYLRSLLLLTVLPPVIGTSHNPNKCLDEIIQVSKSIQGYGSVHSLDHCNN